MSSMTEDFVVNMDTADLSGLHQAFIAQGCVIGDQTLLQLYRFLTPDLFSPSWEIW